MDTDVVVRAIDISGVFANEFGVAAEEWALGVVGVTECETLLVCRRAKIALIRNGGWQCLRDCVSSEGNEEGGKGGKRETHF
jgi:hypothetical protein